MRYDSHQHVSPTLEKLVEVEVQDGHRNSTGCLVRLVRCVFLMQLSRKLHGPSFSFTRISALDVMTPEYMRCMASDLVLDSHQYL